MPENTMLVRINHGIPGHEPESVVTLETDAEGIALEKGWRRRLRDRGRDKCITVVDAEGKSLDEEAAEVETAKPKARRKATETNTTGGE